MMPKIVCELECRLPKTVNHFVHGKIFLDFENRLSRTTDKVKAFEAFREVKELVRKNRYPSQEQLKAILKDSEACLYYIRLALEMGRQIPNDMESEILKDSRLVKYYVALLRNRLGDIRRKVEAIANVGKSEEITPKMAVKVAKSKSFGNYVIYKGKLKVNRIVKQRILDILKRGDTCSGKQLIKKVYNTYGDDFKIAHSDASRCISMLRSEGHTIESEPYRYVEKNNV